jgi:hypothetical protein
MCYAELLNAKLLLSTILLAKFLSITFEIQAQEEVINNDYASSVNYSNLKCIEVPKGNANSVKIDGIFTSYEWSDARCIPITDDYNIYFKADEENLYIGVKSPKQIGELVCEIRFTTDGKLVYLLHVSGGLGEGVSGFPAITKFDLNDNKYWEANYVLVDSSKREKWFAIGSPLDKYDDVYIKRDGVEFKINRKKFSSDKLMFTIGWIRVEIEEGKINKHTYNFPPNADLNSYDNWMELILPTKK